MFHDLEKSSEKFLDAKKTRNLRNALSATRWQQTDHFCEFYPFMTLNVSFQRILKDFEVTVLEKLKNVKVPISIFNPIFWPIGGVKMNFLTISLS